MFEGKCWENVCILLYGKRGLGGYNILEISPKGRKVQSISMAHKKVSGFGTKFAPNYVVLVLPSHVGINACCA